LSLTLPVSGRLAGDLTLGRKYEERERKIVGTKERENRRQGGKGASGSVRQQGKQKGPALICGVSKAKTRQLKAKIQ
jgi:hypothetical protein